MCLFVYCYIEPHVDFLTLNYTHSARPATQTTHFDGQAASGDYNRVMTSMPMPLLTRITGGLLIAIGLLGYLCSWAITALIPLFIGAPLLGCGLIGREGDLRRHFMHAAALLSLMGALGGAFALTAPERLPAKDSPAAGSKEKPFDWHDKVRIVKVATISKTLMTMLSAQHLVLCVASFILGRRALRQAKADAALSEAINESDEKIADDAEASGTPKDNDDSAKA